MAVLLGWLGSGCGGDDSGPGHTGEPPEPPLTTGPSTTSTTTGTDSGSEETGDLACGPGEPCPEGRFCAGSHQAGLLSAPDEFVCISDCVPAGSTAYWCLDDTSCCGGASCDVRYGLCWSDTDTTTSDTSDTESTGTGGSTDTGASTDTSDTGTSTGTTGGTGMAEDTVATE
jgi:hypothetical protein